MKKLLGIIILPLLLCSFCEGVQDTGSVNIIPVPEKVKLGQGVFEITPDTEILVSADAAESGKILQALLRPATGFQLPVTETSSGQAQTKSILLNLKPDKSLGSEGYSLKVSPKSIHLTASANASLFYGIQTLRQLLPPEIESKRPVAEGKWTIPSVRITDRPRFPWRGMHLDVGRHLFPVAFIKKYIDLLAMHKMNIFHLHLTEDQGWRIEIKKYPRLTEVGSKRGATPILSNRKKLDGKPYGGYYTQEELREIVAYAKARFITVVPEIEMPGHSIGALAAYPELGCTGGPYEVRQYWGVETDVYCAGNEKVYGFLEDVLTEVFDIFPSGFIHIGGDECPKARWEECDKCQAMIEKNGLKDEHELQSYFITRIEKFINKHNRRLIGWDEILEGGLAPNAAVMSWRGTKGGIAAASTGHDVVMSPTSHCYFDYYQSKDTEAEPPAIGGFLPLEKVYSFNPIPDTLTPDQAKHILGAQGNVWTEYIPSAEQAEYMAFPRASALAEVVWSPFEHQDYDDFIGRLERLLKRLTILEVNFRDPAKDAAEEAVSSHP